MPDSCVGCGLAANRQTYLPKVNLKLRICQSCGIGFLDQFLKEPTRFYQHNNYYAAWWQSKINEQPAVRLLKEKTAAWILGQMRPFLRQGAGILEVGCAFGYFLKMAARQGYRATGIEVSEAVEEAKKEDLQVFQTTLESFKRPEGSFDAAVMVDVFEHLSDPESALKKLSHLLDKKSGILVIVVPDFGSLSRKIFGQYWLHFKPEHLFYYSKKGITKLLRKHGFEPLLLRTAKKATSLSYIAAHSARYHNLPGFFIELLGKLPLSTAPFLINSELFCIAKAHSD